MNKKAIICTVAILILLVGASVIYFTMNRSSETETANSSSMSAAESESSDSPLETSSEAPTESEPQESASETTSSEVNSPEADAFIKTFAEIGEPYMLHSRYYNQGEAKTEDAPWLGWDGDLELCITDAIVKEYEESDIKYNSDSSIWARYASDFEDPCILHVELSLKNIDAENKNGVKYKFNANMFVLRAYEDLLPENQNNPEGYTTIGNYYSAYSIGEWVPLNGDFFYSKEENTNGYSVRVREAEVVRYEDFMQRFGKPVDYLAENTQHDVVLLTVDFKNENNTEGGVFIRDFNLLNESQSAYFNKSEIYMKIANPDLNSKADGISVMPGTEASLYMVYPTSGRADGVTYLEEQAGKSQIVMYLNVSLYPVKKYVRMVLPMP